MVRVLDLVERVIVGMIRDVSLSRATTDLASVWTSILERFGSLESASEPGDSSSQCDHSCYLTRDLYVNRTSFWRAVSDESRAW